MAQQDVDAINKAAGDLTREKTQIIALVTEQQTSLANAAQTILDLQASNADNAAIVAALNETLMPAVTTAVNEFDVLTPEGTPTLPEPEA